MHLKSEVQFLLVATHGVYGMARAVRWGVTDNAKKVRCVQAAISAFEKETPNAVHLRNLHEHMDEMLRGRGDAYRKLPDPTGEDTVALLDDDVAYALGGKVWSIRRIAVAAKDLVRDIGRCSVGHQVGCLIWNGSHRNSVSRMPYT